MNAITLGYGLLSSLLLLTARPSVVDEPLTDLQGKWKVTKTTFNGKDVNDRQLSNGRLTFHNDELIMESGDGSPRERFKIKLEANSSPRAFHATRIEPANRPQEGWHIYEFKDGRLRMAFYDALRGRPRSFDPQPELIVIELEKVVEPAN